MTRMTIIAAAACLLAGQGWAQGFNDRAPNGAGQTPAFQNQTRAPALSGIPRLREQVFASGLENPWGMAQLPDGSWLVTERAGRLRLVSAEGALSDPIAGVPEVDAKVQGGLLDVAVADDFARTRNLWLAFSLPDVEYRSTTAVARARLSDDGRALQDVEVIWKQSPSLVSSIHYGARLVFDHEGGLFVTTGERGLYTDSTMVQEVSNTVGKVVRINPRTGAPMGRPGVPDAMPEIWSWGHRNPQGAALAPDGSLWASEHGPRGGDEVNRVEAGKNYGWPLVTYGVDYGMEPVGEGLTRLEGTEQPVYYWDPVIAATGMVFYSGQMFPEFEGDLLVGGLQSRSISLLRIENNRVAAEARLVPGPARIRDVDVAQDGAIMILTDEDDGAMIRISR